jgi:ribosomal-protein-alanine N-acetyltransferase
MSELFIRKATPSDVSQIEKIEKSSFSTPWSEKWLLDEINKQDDLFLTVTDGEGILGYAVVGMLGEEAELYNIAVDNAHRGKGLGDMLMKHLTRKALENGAKNLFLEVRESNVPAILLYEKHGFKSVGRRKNYYKEPTEDAILMMLSM